MSIPQDCQTQGKPGESCSSMSTKIYRKLKLSTRIWVTNSQGKLAEVKSCIQNGLEFRLLVVTQGLIIYDALDLSFGLSWSSLTSTQWNTKISKVSTWQKIHPRRKLRTWYIEKLTSLFLKTITIIFTQKYIMSWLLLLGKLFFHPYGHHWLIHFVQKLLMGMKANYLFCICINKKTALRLFWVL